MGCTCSRPETVEFPGAQADVRARYSTDSLRHNADFTGDILFGIHVQDRHAARSGRCSRHSSGSSNSLSRSQWKQMRALARSNANPHFHQLQQLQILPSHALSSQHQQPQQQHAATAGALAGLQQQHHHQHHQHRHQQPVVHATLSPEQALQSPQHQGLAFSSGVLPSHSHHSLTSSKDREKSHGATPKADALSPEQILAVCGAVVEGEGPDVRAAGIHPLLLASLCLIESGGCYRARQFRDHVGDVAIGLCQVLLSTAQWLASSQGFDRYGSSPTAADLEEPKCCAYYCAAYLSVLSRHRGSQRSESFIIKAYHAGPKGVDSDAAGLYWQKYLKAKHCLKEVTRAMAVSVATAAATAGLPLCTLAMPSGGVQSNTPATAGADDCSSDDARNRIGRRSSASLDDRITSSDNNKDAECQSSNNEEVMVWAAAARLITDLSSSWDAAAPADSEAAGAETAVSSSSSSFIAQILPSFWPSAGSNRTQQQTQQRDGSFSVLTASRSSRHRHGEITAAAGSGTNSSSKGCRQWAPVTRAAVDAAILRLCCIDYSSTCIALSNAAAAAALYGNQLSRPLADTVQPSAAATKGTNWYQRRRSNIIASSSSYDGGGSNAADEGALQQLPPCVMHVVSHGESLSQIASICGVGLSDILAANPDIGDSGAVQPNDCIALPVAVVFPRLYVVQQGDTLHGIAKAHRTSLGRILAKNPELTDSSRVQPGWVVMLPGLKGDSMSGAALQWLAEAAAEVEAADHLAGYALGLSHLNPRTLRRGSDDEGLGVYAGAGFRYRSGTQHQDSGAAAAVYPDCATHRQKDVQDAGSEDLDHVQPDQNSSLNRGVRGCAGGAAVAVEVQRSSKDWSYAGQDNGDTDRGSREVTPVTAVSAGVTSTQAAVPLATVGSGLYMFSVGQSIAV